ncbi:hypothetical protein V8E55_003088 [Tylopilus felleus]
MQSLRLRTTPTPLPQITPQVWLMLRHAFSSPFCWRNLAGPLYVRCLPLQWLFFARPQGVSTTLERLRDSDAPPPCLLDYAQRHWCCSPGVALGENPFLWVVYTGIASQIRMTHRITSVASLDFSHDGVSIGISHVPNPYATSGTGRYVDCT